MTNYNERLDDLLAAVYLAGTENGLSRGLTDAEEIMHRKKAFINGNHASYEAKQVITSLIKELVEEAKPSKKHVGDEVAENRSYTGERLFNATIDEYHTNLLKALEEV